MFFQISKDLNIILKLLDNAKNNKINNEAEIQDISNELKIRYFIDIGMISYRI